MVRSSLKLLMHRDARPMQYRRRSYNYSHPSLSTASVSQEQEQVWTTHKEPATTKNQSNQKKKKKKIVIVEMNGLLFCQDEAHSCADDDSDVSSLDSYGSVTSDYHRKQKQQQTQAEQQHQQGQQRRIIFPEHWDLKRRISEATTATMDSTATAAYSNATPLAFQPRRRSLFPKRTATSMPAFVTPRSIPFSYVDARVRKTSSTSALLSKRHPSSILRRANSHNKNSNSNANLSTSSVTFDPNVSIYEFEEPREKFHDPREWYKFFH